ncbi:hypothetical protein [Streptomyces sp. NPDC059816]|uniref:hypothetical protein n=1 Tax=Streptomyces sp. NPDC059816 TaxID=3346960 RepID=UPI00365F6AA9
MTAGVVYLNRIPPFDESAKPRINKSDTCPALGKSKNLVPALRTALPTGRNYIFVDTPIAGHGDGYLVHCAARIKDVATAIVLWSRAMQPMNREDWISKQLNDYTDGNPLEDFKAGVMATASISRAAVQVPCHPEGRNTGMHSNLGVNVFLREAGEASDKDTRQALIDIVRSAAEYAHKDAKCELPSKL